MATMTYERIRLMDGKLVQICRTGETDGFITGYEVDMHGGELKVNDKDRQLHIIGKKTVLKRIPLKLDNGTGMLRRDAEKAGNEILTHQHN